MGRSHALSGAVVWLAGCAATTSAGVVLEPSTVVVGSVVCAGAALLPDLDHPRSTAAHSLGPVTRGLARGVSRVSDWVRDRSCGCCATPTADGHRTLTHTGVGAVVVGAVVSLLAGLAGVVAALVVVGLVAGLGARGLLRRAQRGRWGALAIGVAAAGVAASVPGGGWWWIGLPVGVGWLVHALGDALTVSRCPLLWPLRVNGCRWHRCGMPRLLTFRTGGRVERWLVFPALLLSGLLSAVALV